MLTLLNILKALWPFFREVFFDGKSFIVIVQTNKFAFFLLIMLSLSGYLNNIMFNKIVKLQAARPVIAEVKKEVKPPEAVASEPDKTVVVKNNQTTTKPKVVKNNNNKNGKSVDPEDIESASEITKKLNILYSSTKPHGASDTEDKNTNE